MKINCDEFLVLYKSNKEHGEIRYNIKYQQWSVPRPSPGEWKEQKWFYKNICYDKFNKILYVIGRGPELLSVWDFNRFGISKIPHDEVWIFTYNNMLCKLCWKYVWVCDVDII